MRVDPNTVLPCGEVVRELALDLLGTLAERCRSGTATPTEIVDVTNFLDHHVLAGPTLRTDVPLEQLRTLLLAMASGADRSYRRTALVLDAARSSRRRAPGPSTIPGGSKLAWHLVLAVRSRAGIAELSEIALALGVAIVALDATERGARRCGELQEELRARHGEHYAWWLRHAC